MKKLIVTGLRTCERKEKVYAEISKHIAELGGVDEIITGGSKGVDQFSKAYAEEHGIKVKEFVPDWQSYINSAGFIRDCEMVEYGTHLLILSNGVSKESSHLIAEAKKASMPVKSVGGFEGRSDSETLPAGAFPQAFY